MSQFRSYELAVKFFHDCQQLKLPYYLKDQLFRAASSVAFNLSEGSAKSSVKDRRRFYRMAFASCKEAKTALELHSGKSTALYSQADCLAAHLYKLCRSLEH